MIKTVGRSMMEKMPTTKDNNKPQHYTPHLKKVLKTYQKSAIKSLQGPSTVLTTDTITVKKEPVSESSPELPLETPPPPPVPQVPILSTADQSAELSETLIEGHRISCFIIGGEKRICFVQLLSTVLRNVQAYTINSVCTELFINFSSCNSQQLLALKAIGLLPAETPTCGLVTKPDAERLCSVLLHEGGASPEGLVKHVDFSFEVYHECFSGAKGVLYYEFFTEKNWCVQCVVCRRLFTPQMFVCHSCYMDKKRKSIHTYIETGICHWGFDSMNWRLYIHVCKEQRDYEKYMKILENFKKHHRRSELIPLKRKQTPQSDSNENIKVAKTVIEESPTTTLKSERIDDDEERWYMKKKTKVATTSAEDVQPAVVTCTSVPPYYGTFHTYYSNLCESWVRNATAAASYHPPPNSWPNYPPIPFTKDSKSYYFTEPVPPFLAQDPPVLLNPERVVPLSQSEQFERSFQPNVALAPPPTKSSDVMTYSKLKQGVIRIKSDINSPSPPDEAEPPSLSSTHYSKEERLEKMDVKPRPISPIVSSLPPSAASPKSNSPIQETIADNGNYLFCKTEQSEKLDIKPQPISPPIISSLPPLTTSPRSNSPIPENTPDNGVNGVMEQVVNVLSALGDAEDAVRQRIISLVDRLRLRIDRCDLERQKYLEEISQLRFRLSQLHEENVQLYFDNIQLRQQLENKPEEKDGTAGPTTTTVTPVVKCASSCVSMVNNASYSFSNRNTPGISSSKQPNCSPVSVITSPPPLTVIKSESAA